MATMAERVLQAREQRRERHYRDACTARERKLLDAFDAFCDVAGKNGKTVDVFLDWAREELKREASDSLPPTS